MFVQELFNCIAYYDLVLAIKQQQQKTDKKLIPSHKTLGVAKKMHFKYYLTLSFLFTSDYIFIRISLHMYFIF